MAASGSAWPAAWPKPARRSRWSGRNEAKSAAAVAELKQGGAKAIAVDSRRHRRGSGRRHGRPRRPASSAGSTSSSTMPASISASRRTRSTLAEWHSVIDDQPHQRLPVLAGGLSRHEGGRRRQDHQYRLDDVDLRRQFAPRLCREQGRHRAVHPLLRDGLGRRQHPGQRRAARLDRYGSDQARPRTRSTACTTGCWRARRRRAGAPSTISPGIAVFLASPASDFVTGTAIPVDGGYSIMG